MTRKNPPPARDDAALSLPSDRAFVVQLARGEPDDGGVRGRAEHLASGHTVHFDSWARLREFLRSGWRQTRR
jgi:hypothetical protein